jgi:cell division septation protein DedD
MDYSLKERLIGAIVLVALVVAIIPFLLDGRDDGVSSKSLIPEQQQEENNRQIIVLNLKRNNPSPLSQDSEEFLNFEWFNKIVDLVKNDMGNSKSEDRSKTQEYKIINNSDSSDRPWVIQLGSFSLFDNANQKVKLLNAQGYKSYIRKGIRDNEMIYNVWLGPQRSKKESDELSLQLMKDKHENQVVPY